MRPFGSEGNSGDQCLISSSASGAEPQESHHVSPPSLLPYTCSGVLLSLFLAPWCSVPRLWLYKAAWGAGLSSSGKRPGTVKGFVPTEERCQPYNQEIKRAILHRHYSKFFAGIHISMVPSSEAIFTLISRQGLAIKSFLTPLCTVLNNK